MVTPVDADDLQRMRDALFFEGPERDRRLSKFWLLLVLAAVIASAGVIGDSTATVIGAMIVAPLMTPILGTAVAASLRDRDNLIRSIVLIVAGAAAVIAIAWLLGLTIPSPIDAAHNSQVASRVSPRLIDLTAALATGAVGAIALARSDISDALPGVAIAISLVPPLAVVGLTLESGDGDEALGALLLFVTNVSAILATGVLVMAFYGVRRHAPALGRRGPSTSAVVIGLLVLFVLAPLATTSKQLAVTTSRENDVRAVVDDWAHPVGWEVVDVSTQAGAVVVEAAGPLPVPGSDELRGDLDDAGLADVTVTLELVPLERRVLDGDG